MSRNSNSNRRKALDYMCSLVGYPTGLTPTEILACAPIPQQENTMITETTKTYEMERRYLRDAVRSSRHEKDKELRKHFNIDCEPPRSPKEIVVAIQNGKFKYHDEGKHSEDRDWYCSPFNGICFCDPEKSEDYVGYHTAREKMETDEEAIILKVNVLEPDKSLTHVEEFKKRKYH